ncbi:MAG: hypothetical protein M0Q92_05410 [Methanoregula sp.]|jgi:hypothetical protein|nr:hypothetical protein [Methanoregula sp.]
MDSYKHIEHLIGGHLASRYTRAVEAGIGRDTVTAELLSKTGTLMRCTDIKTLDHPLHLQFFQDDIFNPDLSLYEGADLIYAIRPAIEMIPPLMNIARQVNSDLVVYHLGFERYLDGGEIIDCGVLLHRYVRRSEPVKEG